MSYKLNEHLDIKYGIKNQCFISLGKPSNLAPTINVNYMSGVSKASDSGEIKST
jgi:hypothetical protein